MSRPRVYYNEIDPKAAAWLRQLMKDGAITDGEVDERSILDVRPSELAGFTRCHFFAGIGGWDLALRLAGWPEDRDVWTGSCPCQPFSAAGAQGGTTDERHLWPFWLWLIAQRRPATVFGEQVEAAIEFDWLDLVSTDLEGLGYAVGAAGLPAASVGAFHRRQRLWFVADTDRPGQRGRGRIGSHRPRHEGTQSVLSGSTLGDSPTQRREGRTGEDLRGAGRASEGRAIKSPSGASVLADASRGGLGITGSASGEPGLADERHETGRMADASSDGYGRSGRSRSPRLRNAVERCGQDGSDDTLSLGRSISGVEEHRHEQGASWSVIDGPSALGFWDGAIWIPCRDGKYRPTEPGIQPLSHGVSGRVALLWGAGNAIVPPLAQAFIEAYLDVRS